LSVKIISSTRKIITPLISITSHSYSLIHLPLVTTPFLHSVKSFHSFSALFFNGYSPNQETTFKRLHYTKRHLFTSVTQF
jgi:hypothetical protein